MTKDNAVIFKGGKTGIIVILDEGADFSHISQVLRQKIRDAGNFFAGASTSITFKGKVLSEDEIAELIEVFDDEAGINITYVDDQTGELQIEQKSVKSAKKSSSDEVLYRKSNLRGGQIITHNGSVVILGDVNAGAEIYATGSVMIFGAMRGFAHAGTEGNEKAIVCAFSFQPTHLKIASAEVHFYEGVPDVIKENPSYAFLQDGAIYVDTIST
ncbi:MAG: septum site-determining protein MinC [Defluviitaleaceae bacterium]|nr:septum site-determining protein MinC [Defluviitaleaceae bacterium]